MVLILGAPILILPILRFHLFGYFFVAGRQPRYGTLLSESGL